jgi:hypothetical protein
MDHAPWKVTGEVEIVLGDEPHPAAEVARLASLLSATVAESLQSEDVVVRVVDLPEGQHYVLYRDINVVAVSFRLDEEGRHRALYEAGVH